MDEEWRDIEGYNGRYKISSHGRLKSFAQDRVNGKIKTGNETVKGYLTVLLYDGKGHSKWNPVHRLVASAFLDNPDDLPQVNHKDEDKKNNRVDNLEWCTNEYNSHYGTHYSRVAESNRCCPSTSKRVFSVDTNGVKQYYPSIGEAERKTGLCHGNIVRALKGKCPTCGKKHWFYCEE